MKGQYGRPRYSFLEIDAETLLNCWTLIIWIDIVALFIFLVVANMRLQLIAN